MEAILVALISTVGVVATTTIQSIANRKKDNILDTLQQEILDRCKSDLVILMSRIRNGYNPTTEEKMILYETKKKYNDLGGDSYVDDMFEGLRKEGKI